MSAQWGHGHHKGFEKGVDIGQAVGVFKVAKDSYETCLAAISALERQRPDAALATLRLLVNHLKQWAVEEKNEEAA